jgi:hypothetical protein
MYAFLVNTLHVQAAPKSDAKSAQKPAQKPTKAPAAKKPAPTA